MSSLARCEGRSEFKRGRGGRREAAGRLPRSARTAPSAVPDGSGHPPTTGAHGAGRRARSPDSRAAPSRAEPGGVSGPPRRTHRPAPSPRPRSRRAPSPSMRLLAAALLLLLLLALCAARVDGSKCKCSRKGPKIRYSDVKKLEMKPKYPHCEEKMVIVTTKSVSRYRGQEHCLHPKLQSTKRFIKWYNAWNEKRRVYEE